MARGKALVNAVKPEHMFMSVIGERMPKEKSHATLKNARGAVAWRVAERYQKGHGTLEDMFIYKRNSDGWELVHLIPKGSEISPWQTTQWVGGKLVRITPQS